MSENLDSNMNISSTTGDSSPGPVEAREDPEVGSTSREASREAKAVDNVSQGMEKESIPLLPDEDPGEVSSLLDTYNEELKDVTTPEIVNDAVQRLEEVCAFESQEKNGETDGHSISQNLVRKETSEEGILPKGLKEKRQNLVDTTKCEEYYCKYQEKKEGGEILKTSQDFGRKSEHKSNAQDIEEIERIETLSSLEDSDGERSIKIQVGEPFSLPFDNDFHSLESSECGPENEFDCVVEAPLKVQNEEFMSHQGGGIDPTIPEASGQGIPEDTTETSFKIGKLLFCIKPSSVSCIHTETIDFIKKLKQASDKKPDQGFVHQPKRRGRPSKKMKSQNFRNSNGTINSQPDKPINTKTKILIHQSSHRGRVKRPKLRVKNHRASVFCRNTELADNLSKPDQSSDNQPDQSFIHQWKHRGRADQVKSENFRNSKDAINSISEKPINTETKVSICQSSRRGRGRPLKSRVKIHTASDDLSENIILPIQHMKNNGTDSESKTSISLIANTSDKPISVGNEKENSIIEELSYNCDKSTSDRKEKKENSITELSSNCNKPSSGEEEKGENSIAGELSYNFDHSRNRNAGNSLTSEDLVNLTLAKLMSGRASGLKKIALVKKEKADIADTKVKSLLVEDKQSEVCSQRVTDDRNIHSYNKPNKCKSELSETYAKCRSDLKEVQSTEVSDASNNENNSGKKNTNGTNISNDITNDNCEEKLRFGKSNNLSHTRPEELVNRTLAKLMSGYVPGLRKHRLEKKESAVTERKIISSRAESEKSESCEKIWDENSTCKNSSLSKQNTTIPVKEDKSKIVNLSSEQIEKIKKEERQKELINLTLEKLIINRCKRLKPDNDDKKVISDSQEGPSINSNVDEITKKKPLTRRTLGPRQSKSRAILRFKNMVLVKKKCNAWLPNSELSTDKGKELQKAVVIHEDNSEKPNKKPISQNESCKPNIQLNNQTLTIGTDSEKNLMKNKMTPSIKTIKEDKIQNTSKKEFLDKSYRYKTSKNIPVKDKKLIKNKGRVNMDEKNKKVITDSPEGLPINSNVEETTKNKPLTRKTLRFRQSKFRARLTFENMLPVKKKCNARLRKSELSKDKGKELQKPILTHADGLGKSNQKATSHNESCKPNIQRDNQTSIVGTSIKTIGEDNIQSNIEEEFPDKSYRCKTSKNTQVKGEKCIIKNEGKVNTDEENIPLSKIANIYKKSSLVAKITSNSILTEEKISSKIHMDEENMPLSQIAVVEKEISSTYRGIVDSIPLGQQQTSKDQDHYEKKLNNILPQYFPRVCLVDCNKFGLCSSNKEQVRNTKSPEKRFLPLKPMECNSKQLNTNIIEDSQEYFTQLELAPSSKSLRENNEFVTSTPSSLTEKKLEVEKSSQANKIAGINNDRDHGKLGSTYVPLPASHFKGSTRFSFSSEKLNTVQRTVPPTNFSSYNVREKLRTKLFNEFINRRSVEEKESQINEVAIINNDHDYGQISSNYTSLSASNANITTKCPVSSSQLVPAAKYPSLFEKKSIDAIDLQCNEVITIDDDSYYSDSDDDNSDHEYYDNYFTSASTITTDRKEQSQNTKEHITNSILLKSSSVTHRQSVLKTNKSSVQPNVLANTTARKTEHINNSILLKLPNITHRQCVLETNKSSIQPNMIARNSWNKINPSNPCTTKRGQSLHSANVQILTNPNKTTSEEDISSSLCSNGIKRSSLTEKTTVDTEGNKHLVKPIAFSEIKSKSPWDKNTPSNPSTIRLDQAFQRPTFPISAKNLPPPAQKVPGVVGGRNCYFTPLFVLDGDKVVPLNASNASKYSIESESKFKCTGVTQSQLMITNNTKHPSPTQIVIPSTSKPETNMLIANKKHHNDDLTSRKEINPYREEIRFFSFNDNCTKKPQRAKKRKIHSSRDDVQNGCHDVSSTCSGIECDESNFPNKRKYPEHLKSIRTYDQFSETSSNVSSSSCSEYGTTKKAEPSNQEEPIRCKKRVKSKEEQLEDLLDGAPPFIRQVFKCENITDGFDNRDLMFVLSLLPDIEEMTSTQRFIFQSKVVKLIDEVFNTSTVNLPAIQSDCLT